MVSNVAYTIQGIKAIVLAAGESRRFGSQKLLHHLEESKTLVESTYDLVKQVFDERDIHVVCRKDSPITTMLDPKQTILLNPSTIELGLSASVKHAVGEVSVERGWLFVLGDMPFVQPQTIAAICEKLEPDNIVQPCSQAGRGNPVAFGVEFATHLMNVSGDSGGKEVLLTNPDKVISIDVDDPGIHQDIDTPKDIIRWQQSHAEPDR